MAAIVNATISQMDPQANVTSKLIFQWDFFKISMLTFNFLFGLPLHICVLWLIVTERRIASEFLHLNLSVCEIIVSISCLMHLLQRKFVALVAVTLWSVGLLITGRPLFQCLICVERYLAVVHPVTFLKLKPLRYRLMCSAVAWIISLGSCVFVLFTVVEHETVYMFWLLLQFFLFLFVNLFCCVAVLRALKQSGPGERGREREEENHMKRRAFKRILIITLTVLVLFVPTIISGCIYVIAKQYILQSDFISLSFSCLILAAFVQPVSYLYWNRKLPFCSKCSIDIKQ